MGQHAVRAADIEEVVREGGGSPRGDRKGLLISGFARGAGRT
jgi:hypothetical protein